MGEKEIGVISRYFAKIDVAAIILNDELKIGDNIRIQGATTDFEMRVSSMQINRENIEEAKSGQEIAIKVPERVREKDKVFLIE
ncbi:MAG: translation elongation factor-like protein [Candidatus Hodarchaeota archaeon]